MSDIDDLPPDVHLMMVVDADNARAVRFARQASRQRHSACAALPNIRAAFAAGAFDGAIVRGAPHQRARLALALLEKSVPLLIEPPFAPDAPATKRLVEAARVARTLVCLALPRRSSAVAEQWQKAARSAKPAIWRVSVGIADSQELRDALWPALDDALQLAGSIRRVTACSSADALAVTLEAASGGICQLIVTSGESAWAWEACGMTLRTLRADERDCFAEVRGPRRFTAEAFPGATTTARRALCETWCSALVSGKQSPLKSRLAAVAETQTLWLATLAALKSGKPANL
jgi:predicted dehydrogenase